MDQLNLQLKEALSSESSRQDLLQFIQTAKWTGSNWAKIKRLYKLLEQEGQGPDQLLVAIITHLDQLPFSSKKKEAVAPRNATLGYMKRRVIRLFKKMGQENPNRYCTLVLSLLKEQKYPINFKHQWVLWYLLKGNSERFEHSRHGRGKVIEHEGISFYRREEPFSAIWDQRKDKLIELVKEEGLALEAYDFCIRILSRNRLPLPSFSVETLQQFFKSTSNWLKAVAIQQSIALSNREVLPAELVAYLLYYTKGNTNLFLQAKFISSSNKETATPKPNESLLQKVKSWMAGQSLPSQAIRQKHQKAVISTLFSIGVQQLESPRTEVALSIVQEFKQFLEVEMVEQHLATIVASKHPVLLQLIKELCSKVPTSSWRTWLPVLENLEELDRLAIYKRLGRAKDRSLTSKHKLEQLLRSDSFGEADFAWYLLAYERNQFAQDLAKQFFHRRYYNGWYDLPLQHMLRSEYGAEVLQTHVGNWMRYISFRPNLLVEIAEHGASSIRSLAKAEFIQNLRHYFWNNIHNLKRFFDWEAILEQNISVIRMNRHVFAYIAHYLTYKDEKSQLICATALLKKRVGVEELNGIFSFILKQTNPKRFTNLNRLFAKPKFHEYQQRFKHFILDRLKNGSLEEIQAIQLSLEELKNYLNPAAFLDLMGKIPDAEWERWKETIRKGMELSNQEEWWNQVVAKLEEDGAETLLTRLLEFGELEDAILQLDNPRILDVKIPSMQHLVVAWLNQRIELLKKDQGLLFKTLIHPLPEVRARGIETAQNIELSTSFIIRLLESGMPSTEKLGLRLVDQLEKDTYEELILCMIDSPLKKLRAWALERIESYPVKLNVNYVLECLTEHSDPYVQQFAAQQMGAPVLQTKGTSYLFKNVLNARNKGRAAKETLKQQWSNNPKIPTEILLEMARATNKKDAEWALLELTKAALAGQEINDFKLTS